MPRDRYIETDEDSLSKLWDGLNILESVSLDAVNDLDLCLYGLTQSESIVDAAREAIADAADLDESDVQLTEVAVAVHIGSDTIRALLGSGFRARREDFAYMGEGGEGIRTQTFIASHYKPVIAVSEFSQMALAQSDAWLEDFLQQYGNKQPAQITQSVRRTEEATQPGIPAPVAPAPAVPAQTPKQTSLEGGLKLADILDDFLN